MCHSSMLWTIMSVYDFLLLSNVTLILPIQGLIITLMLTELM